MISQVIFILALLAVAYIVNWKLNWYVIAGEQGMDYISILGLRKPIPWFMVNFFLVVVFIGWVLGILGIGR